MKEGFLKTILEIVFVVLPVVFLIRTFGFGAYVVPTGSMETTLLTGESFIADKLSYWMRDPEYGEIVAFNDPLYQYSSNKLLKNVQNFVWGPTNWTKRIIGKPGDHVQGKIEDGHPVIYRNGIKLVEPYVNAYPLIYVWKQDPRVLLTKPSAGDEPVPKSYDPAIALSSNKQPFYRINPDWLYLSSQGEPMISYPGTAIEKNLDEFDKHLGPTSYWVMGDNRLGSGDSRMWGPLDRSLIHGRIVYRVASLDTDESWWIIDLLKHPIDFWKRVRWHRCFQVVD
jgi:signal peptidase I